MKHYFFFNYFAYLIALLILSSCGGGGGGSISGNGSGSSGGGSSVFNTAEFRSNFGLARIGALTALNNNSTGSGIVVGILDTGIDLDNPEFSGRISSKSTNITEGAAISVDDLNGHGTAVAGIIGAAKNDSGIHGVAPNATLLVNKLNNAGSINILNVASGINSAVSNGAKIINMSFGADPPALPSSTEINAMQNAVNSGVILVVASGNSSLDQVLDMGRLSNCSGATGGKCNGFNANGQMIVVNAVTSNNTATTFGNQCGDTASACMVAPGEGVGFTLIGGGSGTGSGTSFAAPHVAGALAVILQKFPTLSPSDAVSLLFSSATDLGVSGIDNVFGRGLLNLNAAFRARGLTSLPTGNFIGGNSTPLIQTSIVLDPIFGDALASNEFLKKGIVLDKFNRPFRVDLNNRITNSKNTSSLENYTRILDKKKFRVNIFPNTTLNIDKIKIPDIYNHSFISNFNSNEENRFLLESSFINNTYLTYGNNINSQLFFFNNIDHNSNILFDEIFMPQLKFLDKGIGSSFKYKITRNFQFYYGNFKDNNNFNDSIRNLEQYNISHTNKKLKLNFGIGFLNESNTIFNSSSSGAFGEFRNTRSKFVSISTKYKLNENLNIFGVYSENISSIPNENNGFISNWSKIKSNSFSIGIKKNNTIFKNDIIGFSIYQPLRVYYAKADFNIPIDTEKKPFGKIIYEKERLSITPKGRQLSLETSYGWNNEFINVDNFTLIEFNPGHIKENKHHFMIGLKTKISF
ncbi:MAG: hypothetical protein CMM49_02000 [Rhodospirillaceae bacterium]|nr:hypothetical protein [Rhodospirillaceae bacterium]|tara:strand:- start:92 stop:2341 length:2250 start_codon:yes stop_codon:yes gene_type:complete